MSSPEIPSDTPLELIYPMPSGDPSLAYKVLCSTWTMITISGTFLALRLYCRAARVKQLWWDDYILTVGWAFLLASLCMQTFIFSNGYLITILGGPIVSPVNLASDSTMKMALAFSKTSFALTLLRLTKGWLKYVVIACAAVMDVTCLTHAVLVWKAPCGQEQLPFHIQPCWAYNSGIQMYMIGSSISAASDFILALIPISILWNLQMVKREKIGVAIAMSLGVLAGCVAISAAVQSYRVTTVVGTAFSYRLAELSIWIPAEPNATIVAASIPVLRVLFRDVKKRYGSKGPLGNGYLRSDGGSKFHNGTSGHVAEVSSAVKGDNDSETSILPSGGEGAGIRQTRQVTVEYGARDLFQGYGEAIEMDDCGGRQQNSRSHQQSS